MINGFVIREAGSRWAALAAVGCLLDCSFSEPH